MSPRKVSPIKKRRRVDSESDSYDAPRKKVKRGSRKASESPIKINQDFEKDLKTKEA